MQYIVPLILAAVCVYGLIRRVDLFDAFVAGAKDGLTTVYTVAPTLIGLLVAVGMVRASGMLDMLTQVLSPVADAIGFPVQLLPMGLLRPVSGSGATALLTGIYEDCGPDSFVGRCASVLSGSTETTFYAVTLYYSAAGIRRIRHTLVSALLADFTALVMCVVTVNLMMG